MATRAGLFLIVMLFTRPFAVERADEVIVWNVGQGQWVTIALERTCWHFDAGGEFAPAAAVRARCAGVDNRISFSHWDLDHVSFAGRLTTWLPNACVQNPPRGPASARKRRLLDRLPACAGPAPYPSFVDPLGRGTNGRSRVALFRRTLVPGDATTAEERGFPAAFTNLNSVRWLVLGHHGSRTSTSDRLLSSMPNVRAAIASARRARYGHPHEEVRARLHHHGVPLLSTEDWGHVHAWL